MRLAVGRCIVDMTRHEITSHEMTWHDIVGIIDIDICVELDFVLDVDMEFSHRKSR